MEFIFAKLAKLYYIAPALLLALTVHEFSHGLAAYFLGDPTAKRLGRLTLNPLKHLNLWGSLSFLFFNFGWANPVPFNPHYFKNIKRDTAITAAAGPASNFLLALLVAPFFHLFGYLYTQVPAMHNFFQYLSTVTFYLMFYNLILGIFNLIPIPPLDGSKILAAFLSDEYYIKWLQNERKGFAILIILIFAGRMFNFNLIGGIIIPPVNFIIHLLTGINI